MPRSTTVIEMFLDASGEWRWRRKAPNGRVIAVAGEGYHNRQDAFDGMVLACSGLPSDISLTYTGRRTENYLRSTGDSTRVEGATTQGSE